VTAANANGNDAVEMHEHISSIVLGGLQDVLFTDLKTIRMLRAIHFTSKISIALKLHTR